MFLSFGANVRIINEQFIILFVMLDGSKTTKLQQNVLPDDISEMLTYLIQNSSLSAFV